MDFGGALSAIRFTAGRAVDRFIVQPRREKLWAGKSVPFTHSGSEGCNFTLYPTEYVDQHIFLHGIYEKRFLSLLRGRFTKNSVALDIGANIGNHAIYLGGTFAAIHAFEPNPRVVDRLRHNIALNALDDVIRVHPVALGKEAGILSFRENSDGNLGASGFLQPGETIDSNSRQLELPIMNADEYIGGLDLSRIDFIKVDVEGWEAPLFEGMSNTIAKFRPIVAFEFHGQLAGDGEFDRIISALPGYIVVEARYAPEGGTLFEKIVWNTVHNGRPTLERVIRPEARTYENILAFPDELSFSRFSG